MSHSLPLSPMSTFAKMGRMTYAQALKIAMRKATVLAKIKSGEKLADADMRELDLHGPACFMSNTRFNLGPVALTTTLTTNIHNPGTTTGGVACTGAPWDKLYTIINYISVSNKTGSAATVSLWVGATGANAAGTEWLFTGYSVSANSYVDRVQPRRFGQADFLVGGSGTTLSLTLSGHGEIGIGA